MSAGSNLILFNCLTFLLNLDDSIIDSNMAVGCMFYVLLLVTRLLEFTREYAANKDVRRENHNTVPSESVVHRYA